MKNNVLTIVLIIMVAVLSGVCLLLGVGNTVSISLGPLTAEVGELKAVQKEIQKNLNDNKRTDLAVQLALINQRLSNIEQRISNGNPGAMAQRPQQNAPQIDYNKVYTIPEGNSSVLGKKDAPITIVEFSDFQCPFCARFHPVVDEVLKAYPDKVKLVIKNFPLPFHPNALPAAKLALAAKEQGKYFEMVDLLLKNGGAATDDKVKEYAKTLGLNAKKLADDLKNKDAQYQKLIDEDKALAQQVNVMGTPTYYLNGKVTSSRDLAAYKVEIDKILSQKKT